MSQLTTFTASPGQTSFTTRLTKAVQHLEITRFGTLAVLMAGLLAGLPETVSAEITHPIRDRVRLADRVELGHIALWGQFGRGAVVEFAPVGVGVAADGSVPASSDPTQLFKLTVKYYLNDKGAIEVLADDHFNVTIENCVPGSQYELAAPEVPVNPAYASMFNKFEPGIILENDRERKLQVAGKAGIIIPNRPDIIERIILTIKATASMPSTQVEATLEDLLAAQADANPVVLLHEVGGGYTQQRTVSMTAQEAQIFLVDFGMVEAIQIDTVIGQQLRYTVVSMASR